MEEKEMIICALKEKIQLSEIDKTRKGALETKQTELLKDETIFNSAVIFSQLQAAIVELKTSFSQNGICDSTLFLSMDNYCSVLKEHLLKLQGKCTYLEDLLSQGNDEREALEISLATLQSQYDVRAWTSLEMEKKFLEFQRSYELTTEKLNEELTVAETIIKEKNLEVRKLQEQRENIEDFFKIVNEKNSNNEERLREAEATLERCSSLQEEKNEIKFLLEKINEQETLLGAVESLSEQLEKLKEMLETKDRECGALNHQLLEAEFRISSLDSLLETKSNEFIRLQTEVEGKNALKHENKNLHEQLAGALAREDESNKKLDQLKFEVCSKQSAFEAAEKDLYDLNLKLSLANQLADKKTEEANKLLETINIYKKLDEELIKKNEIICNLEQRCSDSKVEYDHLKSLLSDTLQELEKYHAANESISIKHENLQQEYTILQETVDENAQQLLLAEEKLKELQSQYDTAKAERFSLYSELERLKEVEALCNASKCATFCKRLNDLQTAENALKESLSAKEAEVIGYSTEVMEMKKELKQSYEKLETLKE
ncbi:kinesin-related protein 4-like [Zophobas morio]|uniref:kinesin-related protein 4-like n=1 Tax=Zophobas morio TaxID=2755281 RepID=UPI003083DE10